MSIKDVGRDRIGRDRNAGLDGIRGLAALGVLYTHAVVHLGLLPFHPLGAMGVIMFFALSGYLIARICWREPSTVAAYREFLTRRLLRLAPVSLALVLVGGPLLLLAGQLRSRLLIRDGLYALTQTTAFAQGAGVATHPTFAPTWSLTVEWVYYLTFPIVLLLLRRRMSTPAAVGKALGALSIALFSVGLLLPPVQFYVLPVANLAVLYAGAALACWHEQHAASQRITDTGRTAMALAMLTIFIFLPGYTHGWGWKVIVLPVATVSTLVLIHGCWAQNPVAHWLAWRPLRQVGLRAYSLYLWHMPVLWVVWVNFPDWPRWLLALVALAGVAGVTAISFRLLEQPVLSTRSSHKPARPQPNPEQWPNRI